MKGIEFDVEPVTTHVMVRRSRCSRKAPPRGYVLSVARKVLDIVRRNIRYAVRWKPVQYGARRGMRALEGTEDQWKLSRKGPNLFAIHPIREKARMWRGHIFGTKIVPVRKKWLRFFEDGDSGREVFVKKVKLPRRDPRPRPYQLKRLEM